METLLNTSRGILIQNTNHLDTEQIILNALYKKLELYNFEYNNNIELKYITQYLNDFNQIKHETFCYSKKSGRTGMSTTYLIESLDPRSKNSAIVLIDKDTYDVLGVLLFNYIERSSLDYDYDNSLYIDSFCTNQQNPIPGVGKLLLTSIIKATTDLGIIDNIFLTAATKDSEGFYEKFKFTSTGKIDDKMKEYKYSIGPVDVPVDVPIDVPIDVRVDAPVQDSVQEPVQDSASLPVKKNYIKIWTGGNTLRSSLNKIQKLSKIYGKDFFFDEGKKTIKRRKNTHKKRAKKKTRKYKKRHITTRNRNRNRKR
jgi:hypothetical protein